MLNKVILMGRLTANPELRHTNNGIPVTSFTLAVNRRFARQGEQQQTDFIDIVAWRGTAEFVTKYFTKGQLVAVCGSLQTRNWQDQNGNNRKSVEVSAEEVHFAEPKRSGGPAPAAAPFNNDFPAPAPAPSEPSFTAGSVDDFEEIDVDDDLPF